MGLRCDVLEGEIEDPSRGENHDRPKNHLQVPQGHVPDPCRDGPEKDEGQERRQDFEGRKVARLPQLTIGVEGLSEILLTDQVDRRTRLPRVPLLIPFGIPADPIGFDVLAPQAQRFCAS